MAKMYIAYAEKKGHNTHLTSFNYENICWAKYITHTHNQASCYTNTQPPVCTLYEYDAIHWIKQIHLHVHMFECEYRAEMFAIVVKFNRFTAHLHFTLLIKK